MIQRTYINKFNTITCGSKQNTGISPISELCYGLNGIYTRGMLYFDHERIKSMVENGIFPDISKFKHTLHITNAGSLDFTEMHCKDISRVSNGVMQRASSFDIIFFLIPKYWDRGKGFNYKKNFIIREFYSNNSVDQNRYLSQDGANWYQARNGIKWDEEGIYSNDTLSREYDNFSSDAGSSVIIGRQRFDVGNENIELDVTDIFNKFITGELENYGIGFAFTPMLELSEDKFQNYIGFLTDKTTTFFPPYIETFYDDQINDSRADFALNKTNKLYLYCTIGSHLENLDHLPTCTIKNSDEEPIFENLEVKQYSKGIYYVELMLPEGEFEEDTMLYDVWSDIYYQNSHLTDVELDFTTKRSNTWFNIGNALTNEPSFTPSVSGINEKEQIKRGDVRKLSIKARTSYTNNDMQIIDGMSLRLYIKDGTAEIDVIPWDNIEKTFKENYYIIDTDILLPQRYYVDIRINYGMNSIIHHDVLTFDIVNDLNNKYA